jgi:predicted transcriptional regulator
MRNKKNTKPTSAELEILQILWQNDSATVKTINEKLNKKKPVGYTTTLKIMQIMLEKGLLEREKEGRSHIYKAVKKQSETQNVLLEKVLETAFGGSASKLVMQAIGRDKTSDEELKEIKKFILQMEKERNESK